MAVEMRSLPPAAAYKHPVSPPRLSRGEQQTHLSLTIRHLPSDRWESFTVPHEWRLSQLKQEALKAFDSLDKQGRRGSAIKKVLKWREEKEKDSPSKSGAGGVVKQAAGKLAAVASKVKLSAPRPLRAIKPKLPSLPSLSPTHLRTTHTPSADSTTPLASDYFDPVSPSATLVASPQPLRPPVLSFFKKSPKAAPRSSMESQTTSDTLVSSTSSATAPSSDQIEPAAGEQHASSWPLPSHTSSRSRFDSSVDPSEGGTEGETRRSQSLTEKSGRGKLRKTGSDKRKKEERDERPKKEDWCLANAVMGCMTAEHHIVGAKLVNHDLLTLKPKHVDFDPPLSQLHLPFLRLTADCSTASLKTAEVDLSRVGLPIVEETASFTLTGSPTASPWHHKPANDLPLVQLVFAPGEKLVVKLRTRDDYAQFLRLVDVEDEESDEAYESEMSRRKLIIDRAYASRHRLPLPPLPQQPRDGTAPAAPPPSIAAPRPPVPPLPRPGMHRRETTNAVPRVHQPAVPCSKLSSGLFPLSSTTNSPTVLPPFPPPKPGRDRVVFSTGVMSGSTSSSATTTPTMYSSRPHSPGIPSLTINRLPLVEAGRPRLTPLASSGSSTRSSPPNTPTPEASSSSSPGASSEEASSRSSPASVPLARRSLTNFRIRGPVLQASLPLPNRDQLPYAELSTSHRSYPHSRHLPPLPTSPTRTATTPTSPFGQYHHPHAHRYKHSIHPPPDSVLIPRSNPVPSSLGLERSPTAGSGGSSSDGGVTLTPPSSGTTTAQATSRQTPTLGSLGGPPLSPSATYADRLFTPAGHSTSPESPDSPLTGLKSPSSGVTATIRAASSTASGTTAMPLSAATFINSSSGRGGARTVTPACGRGSLEGWGRVRLSRARSSIELKRVGETMGERGTRRAGGGYRQEGEKEGAREGRVEARERAERGGRDVKEGRAARRERKKEGGKRGLRRYGSVGASLGR
ncbi:hypothetical protein JCM6882_002653 [Rhodosporidiobolus microsporus]